MTTYNEGIEAIERAFGKNYTLPHGFAFDGYEVTSGTYRRQQWRCLIRVTMHRLYAHHMRGIVQSRVIGVGDTLDEAIADGRRRLESYERRDERNAVETSARMGANIARQLTGKFRT